jgi:NAD(P)-dependent dehydrogenase (short-subunit alcohol dehydrogenase family)
MMPPSRPPWPQCSAKFGRIDILVNCAAAVGGQRKPPMLAEITNKAFFADINVNVKVIGYLPPYARWRPTRRHKAVGTSSTSRISRRSKPAPRSAQSLTWASPCRTKNLADELAPSNISVVCVNPGCTRTEKTAEFVEPRRTASQ